MSVYLDYAATTPVDPLFVKDVSEYMLNKWYNPSAAYNEAGAVKRDMEEARDIIAKSINAEPSEIIFTSGATEANNMVLEGRDYNLYLSPYEHPSVKNKEGVHKHFIDIDNFNPEYGFYSVMLANNETGTIFPIKELCSKVIKAGGAFHTDATQAYGHIPIDVKDLGVDFLTISLHKCGCAKGIGFLYKSHDIELDPLMHGGGQERGLRPGTENTAFIYAAGQHVRRMGTVIPDYTLRDYLKSKIKLLPYCHINETDNQLPNILLITIDGVRSDVLISLLNERGICVSAGSACHAGDPRPSKTLLAFGLSENEALRTIRVSWGKETTKDDLDYFVTNLKQIIEMIE